MMDRALIHATSVFPAPTSPCKSLYIGGVEDKSSLISSIALSWSGVREKGRDEIKAFSNFDGFVFFIAFLFFFSLSIDNSKRRSSVKARVLLPFSISVSSFGQWTKLKASVLETSLFLSIVSWGRISSKGERETRANRVASLTFFCFRFPLKG